MPDRIMHTEAWTEHERFIAAALTFLSYPNSVRETLWRETSGNNLEERSAAFTAHINQLAVRIKRSRFVGLNENGEPAR